MYFYLLMNKDFIITIIIKESFQNQNTSAQSRLGEHGPDKLQLNFHHEHFIDPTNCPRVSEDGFRPSYKRGRGGEGAVIQTLRIAAGGSV